MAESGSVAQVSANYKNFFNESFAGRFVEIDMIDSQLIWDTMLTSFVGTSNDSIKKYITRVDSSGNRITPVSSPNRVSPKLHTPNTAIPKIKQDDYTIEYEGLNEYSLGVDFAEDIQSFDNEINRMTIKDQYTKIGESFLRHMNGEILKAAFNDFSYTPDSSLATYMDNSTDFGYAASTEGSFVCGNIASGVEWDTDAADYLVDLSNIRTAGQKQSDYIATFDRGAVDITVLEDVVLWGQTSGYSWELSPIGNGRSITSLNGFSIIGTNNVDGLSGNEGEMMFFDSRFKPCMTHYSTKRYKNYSRWGQNAKIMTATDEHGPDSEKPNVLSVLFRYGIGTSIQPYHEYFYGVINTTS